MNQLTILSIKKIDGKPQLRAFVDVALGEITIYGIRLMEDPKGYWLGFPQNAYESHGKTKYAPIVEVTEGLKKLIKDEIIKEYKKA